VASDERARRVIEELLASIDVCIDGGRPFDPCVNDPRFYGRVLAEGSLGLGESYMDGWWDCERIDELATRIFRDHVEEAVPASWRMRLAALEGRLRNRQGRRRALRTGSSPYQFGDDVFEAMLDPRMVYSCAYWRRASSLAEAQEHKLELICRKLDLKPGMRVLDVGCGWGGFARYAAESWGAEVVGINLSDDQARIARERCAGLPVEIRKQDYRELRSSGDFQRVVSIGMFEHVGYKNYRRFFEVLRGCLAPAGLALLHTIGRNRSATGADLWMTKYVFPDAMLPSASQLSAALEGLFVIEDWHNFSADYDRTLMSWHENFEVAWDGLRERGYDERFRRMWRFYLHGSAARFRARRNQLWQLVLSERGVPGGYASLR
jgi:cyclopropane-fatty-acyl-phospholipid synthase